MGLRVIRSRHSLTPLTILLLRSICWWSGASKVLWVVNSLMNVFASHLTHSPTTTCPRANPHEPNHSAYLSTHPTAYFPAHCIIQHERLPTYPTPPLPPPHTHMHTHVLSASSIYHGPLILLPIQKATQLASQQASQLASQQASQLASQPAS